MIARAFRPVAWVAGIGAAALVCYMLSLQVAAERAELASIEQRILETRQQIRSLNTELGTRGRLQQLEAWNADVLALSAPVAAQFLDSNVALARFDAPEPEFESTAPVRMASAETPAPPAGATPKPAQPAAPTAVSPRVRLVSATSIPSATAAASRDSTPSARPRPASVEAAPSPTGSTARSTANARSERTAAATSQESRPAAASPRPPRTTGEASARPAPAATRPARAATASREGGLLDERTVRALGSEARSERDRARD
jgi:hypothetical protein